MKCMVELYVTTEVRKNEMENVNGNVGTKSAKWYPK